MGKSWSEKEENKLSKLYPNHKNKVLSKKFNRTINSIRRKADRLGLSKSNKHLNKVRDKALQKAHKTITKGYKINSEGYKQILCKNHPNRTKNNYVMEHRLVMEKKLGRYLRDKEVVHHINGDKLDNRIENLKLMTIGEHSIEHNTGRKFTEKTKNKISNKAKERYEDESNHPSYKEVDVESIFEMKKEGYTIKEICNEKDISKGTYYNKIKKYKGVV